VVAVSLKNLSCGGGDSACDIADIVRRCTFNGEGEREEEARKVRRNALRAKVEGQDRLIRILEGTSSQLEKELERLADLCERGDGEAREEAREQVDCAREACDSHARDLLLAKKMRDASLTKLERMDASERTMRERLSSLAEERCPLCREGGCNFLMRCCSTTLCRACALSPSVVEERVCPSCHSPITEEDVISVPCAKGMDTKMTKIGELISSLNEPVILFVQWKSMIRVARSFLSSIGLKVLLLDGNTNQRASILYEFLTEGVLLLCLEECFAGLHLPHVRRIIFAHAIVGDRKQVSLLEKQAIARCVRQGQTERVKVHSFVVTESEEEKLWRNTHD
jgi:SNF2 family DNA or RNA helicase